MDPKRVVEEGFDRIAARHAEWAGRTRTEERARYLAVLVGAVPEGSRVLELGCGAGGSVTSTLAARYRLTGVDISGRSLEMARQTNPDAEFLHGDMTEVTFPHATFDAVTAFYSIIHVPRDEQGPLLTRIASWLRPGGVFVGTLGALDTPADYAEDWLGVRMFWSSHEATVGRRLVEEAGLAIERAVVETADEDGKPISFLWIVARKPGRHVPDFSGFAESYSASRPRYPAELFDWLTSMAPRRDVAWDTATGNGQAAVDLAARFDRVIATDTSEAQIRHAIAHPRVEYRATPAEKSGLPDGSVDLIVAAAALHWFDLPRFYGEAKRVARPGGVLAAWTYHVAHVEPPLDEVLWPFYRDVVGPHFAPGARLVDARYEGIRLPGLALEAPSFTVSVSWTAKEILDFVRTWSGVHAYREATGEDPVSALVGPVEELCGSRDSRHEVRWPVYLRASTL